MRARYLYLIALVIFLLDQISKHAVVSLLPFGSSMPVISGVFHLTTIRNPGGAFGLLQSWAGLLTIITLIVVIGIMALVWIRRRESPLVLGIALSLMLGGALGNLVDRARFGYVVDFIDLQIWPVFNIADMAITVGIALLAYYLILFDRQKETEITEKG